MTAIDEMFIGPMPPAAPAAAAAEDSEHAGGVDPLPPDGAMLRQVLAVLERDGLPYCVTHAYEHLPRHIVHDVDCVVPRAALPGRLAGLLKENEAFIGGRLVQWFEERANFVVLQGYETSPTTGGPVMLQLHISSDFEVKNRVVAGCEEILATRRSFLGRFCVPAAQVEFACILANRVDKLGFEPHHLRQLSALWAAEPQRCSEQLERMFGAPSVALVAASALRNEWEPVIAQLPRLRREMMWKLALSRPLGYLGRIADKHLRRLKRWCRPRGRRGGGLHVVFLGPDGVGKSTVIEAVQQRIAPAFLRTAYQTFARSLLGRRPKASPHALPPRSLPASLLKAAWWFACYTVGYFFSIYPTLVRGGLVINHRYLLDAMVDPRRYRYAGPIGLLRAIWATAPKPDLVIVLDAPADIIHARKRETTLEETTRQREAYLALALTLPNARIVDTSRSPQQTIDDVTNLLLDHMAAGVARRLKLTP
jgi:thymidylate kinase